jgi:hypothetical protein
MNVAPPFPPGAEAVVSGNPCVFPYPVFLWALGVERMVRLKNGPISKNSFSSSPGALEKYLPKVPGHSFKEGKMRIHKTEDGVLWVFSEEKHGWIHLTDTGLNPGELLDKLIKEKMAEDRGYSFSEAFAEIQKGHPGITQQYREQLRSKR